MIHILPKNNEVSSRDLNSYIKRMASIHIQNMNLRPYLTLELFLQDYLHSNISLRDILLNIINNIKITDNGSYYLLDISNNPLTNNKDCPETLFKLITYGNLNIKGSQILIDALKYALNY